MLRGGGLFQYRGWLPEYSRVPPQKYPEVSKNLGELITPMNNLLNIGFTIFVRGGGLLQYKGGPPEYPRGHAKHMCVYVFRGGGLIKYRGWPPEYSRGGSNK